MKKILVLKENKINEVLEVTGKDLDELTINYNFININEHDMNTVDFKSDKVVGVIAGNINNIDEIHNNEKPIAENPNCWFIIKEFFDKNYINLEDPETRFSFGDTIVLLKAGYKVARIGWNGKGMFLFLVPGSKFKVSRPPLLGIYPEGTEIEYQPHIDMKTAQDTVVPWLASQADILAEDWVLVE